MLATWQIRLVIAALAVFAAVPSTAGAAPKRDSPLPRSYISDFATRGVFCPQWDGRTWEYWNTYAGGFMARNWISVASNKKLCGFAEQSGRSLTDKRSTGLFFPELYSAAFRGRRAKLEHNVPKGWTCYLLPSQWALSGFDKFDSATEPGGALSDAFGTAQGITAPAGYCVKGAVKGKAKKGKGKKGKSKAQAAQFITWGPALGGCQARLKLIGHPDPTDSSHTIYPSYGEVSGTTNVLGFYEQSPCGDQVPIL